MLGARRKFTRAVNMACKQCAIHTNKIATTFYKGLYKLTSRRMKEYVYSINNLVHVHVFSSFWGHKKRPLHD